MILNQKKQNAEAAIIKLNDDFIYFSNNADHQRTESEKLESERRSHLKKIRLESAIKELQNSQEYTSIEMIVKQQVNKMFGDDKQLLKFAFETIIESLLKNPYRLQSFMEYSMSVAYTSDSLCNANHNGKYEMHPSLYSQCYQSSNYYSDCTQMEKLRNIILDESERLYNQKVEEVKNQTICEASVYGSNKVIEEKQSIKELPLLGSAES
jgi:hypothetical protein